MERRTVLVVEDHPMVANAMLRLVAAVSPDITVVLVSSAEEAFAKAKSMDHLSLILLDFGLPGLSGIEAIRKFRQHYPGAKVIIISGSEDRHVAVSATRAGADAFVSKAVDMAAMRDIIYRALFGKLALREWISTAGKVFLTDDNKDVFTGRQREVLALMLKGQSNKEIGMYLGIAEVTVKMHVSAIFRELNVINRTQVVLEIRRLGLDEIDS